MEGNTPQVPTTQEVQPEVKDVSQAPQQPPTVPQIPPSPAGGSTPSKKPKKKSKVVIFTILIIALVGLAIAGFFIWKNFSSPGTSAPWTKKTEEEVPIYKGIWLPGMPANTLASNIQEMKGLGLNTVSLAIMIIQEEGNQLVGLDTSHILNDIQLAHENGMKVMLTPIIYPKPRLEEKNLETLNLLIIEAAELAEEYNVELFAPLAEPETLISGDVAKWRQEILPKVKRVYHGEVFWDGPGVGSSPDKAVISQIAKQSPSDFVGYDYVGVTILLPVSERLNQQEKTRYADRLTLDGYSQYVEGAIDYTFAKAERDGCKGVFVTEFGVMDRFFPAGSGVGDVLEEEWLSEEELARALEIVFEKGKDKVSGFMIANFLGMEVPGMPGVYVEGVSETEKDVISKWFTETLPEKKIISY